MKEDLKMYEKFSLFALKVIEMLVNFMFNTYVSFRDMKSVLAAWINSRFNKGR